MDLIPSGDKRGFTALHHAAHGGHAELIRLLLNDYGISPNMQTQSAAQNTALHLACLHGRIEAGTLWQLMIF